MYKRLGNVAANPCIGMIFVRWMGAPKKSRIQGRASLHLDDPLMSDQPGAGLVVRVDVERIFDSCPRYLHRMVLEEYSAYVPERGQAAPIPDWKRNPAYSDALPGKDLAAVRDVPQT